MAEKREDQMKEITEKLEQGVKELFTSDMYTEYLNTMSKFHNYSFNNTVLIAMQKPEATLVAGYQAWQKRFGRHVKKGQRGIKIIAPTPIKLWEEVEKYDPDTHELLLRPDGQPETEEVVSVIPRFRVTTVFDVSQTDGKPLPEIEAKELLGSVENFEIFMKALEMVSPVPSRFDQIAGEAKGYYDNERKEIVIRESMSESQTMKTAVHEVTHAMLHDRDVMEEQGEKKDRLTREVEAESVAYTVCQYFGLDTSDYSFPYIASWSSGRDMKELRSSMDLIRRTAGSFIDRMMENIQSLQREQPEKTHLQETDLILNICRWSTKESVCMVVENMDKKELLEQLKAYQEGYSQSEEITVDAFLIERGARLIPWYDSKEPGEKKEVSFCDVEYDYENGIRDTEKLSALEQASMMIDRVEYAEEVLSRDDKGLIMNYAIKFDDLEDTINLLKELREAVSAGNAVEAEEIRERAREEIKKLPDITTGIMFMHEYGYQDDSMLPLSLGAALELHQEGLHIYCLQKDGSAVLMNTEQEILENGHMFGVDARSWENYRVLEAAKKEVRVTEETSRLTVKGCTGTWHTAEKKEIEGEAYYLMDENGKTSVGQILVDEKGKLVADQLKFGFASADEAIIADLKGKGKQISVYPHSFPYASEHGEAVNYHLSQTENIFCRGMIENTLRENFDGKWLKDGVVKPVIEAFGAERVAYVLACTVRHHERDGRFSRENKEWAGTFHLEEDKDIAGNDRKIAFLVETHPAVLNGFIDLVRKELREMGIEKTAMQMEEAVSEQMTEQSSEPMKGPEGKISFYVAECTEFPVLGEYHENLTLQEAFQIYEKIPGERMSGCKGIGFCLDDGSMYDGNYELMICGEMQTDLINMIDHYRESPLVQKAITDMEAMLSGQAEKIVPGPDRSPEVKKEPEQKSEVTKEPEPEPGLNTGAKRDSEPSWKLQTEKTRVQGRKTERKPSESEKRVRSAPQTDNSTMAGASRKQSVLSALRKRQDKMREQNKPEQKASARGKGEQEL